MWFFLNCFTKWIFREFLQVKKKFSHTIFCTRLKWNNLPVFHFPIFLIFAMIFNAERDFWWNKKITNTKGKSWLPCRTFNALFAFEKGYYPWILCITVVKYLNQLRIVWMLFEMLYVLYPFDKPNTKKIICSV